MNNTLLRAPPSNPNNLAKKRESWDLGSEKISKQEEAAFSQGRSKASCTRQRSGNEGSEHLARSASASSSRARLKHSPRGAGGRPLGDPKRDGRGRRSTSGAGRCQHPRENPVISWGSQQPQSPPSPSTSRMAHRNSKLRRWNDRPEL